MSDQQQTDKPPEIEEWAEQGCIRFRAVRTYNGVRMEVLTIADGWPGQVLAVATLADFRAKRLREFLEKVVPS